jgi:GNAT superfamily N-acetyltransferase
MSPAAGGPLFGFLVRKMSGTTRAFGWTFVIAITVVPLALGLARSDRVHCSRLDPEHPVALSNYFEARGFPFAWLVTANATCADTAGRPGQILWGELFRSFAFWAVLTIVGRFLLSRRAFQSSTRDAEGADSFRVMLRCSQGRPGCPRRPTVRSPTAHQLSPLPSPMAASFDIRLATPADFLVLATQRVAMFRDMRRTTPEIEQPLLESCAGYLAKALASGEYVGWVAHLTAPPYSVIGGAGVQFRPLLPRTDPTGQFLLLGREGLVLNVYVDEAHRRQGVARRLMETLIGWAPRVGIVRLVLHSSPDGRRLYESLGFFASNEMLFPPFGAPPTSGDGAG